MRLFVALRPPADALEHLARAFPARPAGVERWHLTLAFLGEVADADPLRAPLVAAAAGCRPLELQLVGSGEFRRYRAVWMGVGGDVAGLQALAAALGAACRSAGIALEDRHYRPHLTIGRRPTADPAPLASYTGPAWIAHEVELVQSHLGGAVRHEVLDVRGHVKVPAGGHGKSPRVASGSPHLAFVVSAGS